MPYQPRGSGFVGLQQYLHANQGAAQRMGQGLAEQVEKEGQAAQGAIDTGVSDFRQQAGVNQEFVPLDATPSYNYDVGKRVQAQGNLDAATKVLAGPQQLGNADALLQQANAAQQTAQLASTDAGRAVLLNRGRTGTVSQGGGMLDAFLAGRGGGERLDKASANFSRLRDYLGTAQKGAEADVAAARGRATAAKTGAEGYLSTPWVGVAAPAPTVSQGPQDPRIENAQRVEEENRLKARYGAKG